MARPIAHRLTALPLLLSCFFCAAALAPEKAKPGKPIDYARYAFYPDRWKEQGKDTQLVPWKGKEVVLLTATKDLDPEIVSVFLDRLDAAWLVYADLVGERPKPRKVISSRIPIAAVPDSSLTCGLGCGMVGFTGIEVAGFYDRDLPMVAANREAFPHYYFYEMGRNYFVFGDRHSAFTTGFAVFMRYVCMDALACEDPEEKIREGIEDCIERYERSELPFLETFTNVGDAGEKGHRLTGEDGKPLRPSDQPVMYAAAMLYLREELGGDDWVKSFFEALTRCSEAPRNTGKGAEAQCLNWLVAASIAAKRDLSDIFCDRWRMELSRNQRKTLAKVRWKKRKLDPDAIVQQLQ